MSASTLYVYAIVPPTAATGDLATGIDSRPVIAVDGGQGAAALVHRHDEIPYEGADDDVRRWVLEHSSVVDRAWDSAGTVLPVSFNVIVSPDEEQSSDDVLRAWLQENADVLRNRLDALNGAVELRIEIAVDTAEASVDSQEVEQVLQEMATKPAGVQRLYQKKLDKVQRDVADRIADSLYPDFRRRILKFSEEVVENRQSRAGHGTVPVLNVSVLVDAAHVEPLGVELAQMRDSRPGLAITFLGPWPPYSFGDLPTMGEERHPANP